MNTLILEGFQTHWTPHPIVINIAAPAATSDHREALRPLTHFLPLEDEEYEEEG